MQFQKHIYLLFSLILIFSSCKNDDDANTISGSLDFAKIYGGSKNESAQSVVSTTDGGYAILGFTQSIDGDITNKTNDSFDYWLLKFNAENELQWEKTYGGTQDDRGRDIIQTQDGGYAILGSSFSNDQDVSNNAGQEDYWLAKLDASGSKTLHAGGDYWALKLNTFGDIEWSKFYGGLLTDTPEGIVETNDNAFIIAGGSDSADTDITNNKGSYDFWIIKISATTGELIWEKSFGGDEIDEARAITKSADGNYIIAGDTRSMDQDISNNKGAADLWLIKISPQGELLWEKTIGGSNFDVARAIVKTQDNGFLLAGSSRSSDVDVETNNGQNDAWVLKVDSDGNLEWETTVGGSNIDFAYGVAELNDKTVVAVGDASSSDGDLTENKGFTDLLVIKIK